MPALPQFNGGETVKRGQRRDVPGPVPVRGIQHVENDITPALAAVRGVRVDPQAFAAPAEGMARMGDALGKAGEVLGRLAEEQQKAINIRHLAEGEAAMQAAQDEAAAAIAQEPDETKWHGIAESVWEKASGQWNREEFAPVVSEALASRAVTARSRMLGETRVASARESFKKAAGVFEAARVRAVDNLDIDGANAAIDQLEKGGYISAGEAERNRVSSRKTIEHETERRADEAAKATVEQSAMADPDNFEANNADLAQRNPSLYFHGLDMAEQQIRGRIKSASDDLANGLADGSIVTPADIERVAAGRLGPAALAKARDVLQKQLSEDWKAKNLSPEAVRKNFGALFAEADAYDRKKDKDGAGYADLVIKIKTLLPEELRGEVTGPLARKWNPSPAPEPPDAVKDYVDDTIRNWYQAGKFGAITKEEPVFETDEKGQPKTGWFGGKPKQKGVKQVPDRAGIDKANLAVGQLKLDLMRWMEANPEDAKNPEKVREALARFGAKSLVSGDVDALRKSPLPAAAPRSWPSMGSSYPFNPPPPTAQDLPTVRTPDTDAALKLLPSLE